MACLPSDGRYATEEAAVATGKMDCPCAPNGYDGAKGTNSPTESHMTIRNAVATVVGCTLLFAAIGATIGYGLGALRPGYYRTVYRVGREPWFDPVSVGIGQGVTQGTGGGA